MNPQEKAKELVEKYLNTAINFPYIDTEDGQCVVAGYMTYESAIKCAINEVDGILKVLNSPPIRYGQENHMLWKATVDYWNQVLAELQPAPPPTEIPEHYPPGC
jgi:hypothetical protein